MKNFYFLLMFILTTSFSQAQSDKIKPTPAFWSATNASSGQRAFLYEFSVDTMAYADLPNPISINQGEIWDDPFYEVSVPFPFYFMGEQINLLSFGDLGGILFGFSDSLDSELAAAIAPLDTDLIDRGSSGNESLSPLSYQVMGSPGNQVLVIEWKNAGSYDEMANLGTLNMYISFQVWLFESDNSIIFHYGPSMIDDPINFYYQGTGAVIGLAALDLGTFDGYNFHLLEGSADNPSLTEEIVTITGTPQNGTRYIFTPDISSTESSASLTSIQIFPNPAEDILYITSEEPILEMTLFSAGGVPLRTFLEQGSKTVINISDLASGYYLLQSLTQKGVQVSQLVKQ